MTTTRSQMKQGRVVIITARELYTNYLSDIKMNEMYLVIRIGLCLYCRNIIFSGLERDVFMFS